MRTFDFDLALAATPDFDGAAFLDAVEGPLFETFAGDVSPAVLVGRPYLVCAVEAETMEAALSRVVREASALGLSPTRAEIPVDALA